MTHFSAHRRAVPIETSIRLADSIVGVVIAALLALLFLPDIARFINLVDQLIRSMT